MAWLTHEQAIYQISEAFVNYDIPMPKYVQYMDEMGLLPFIKYFLSIQRVLSDTLRDNPLQVVNTLALSNLLGGLPVPTDSSMFVRFGNNPFDTGVFGMADAMTELATVQVGMGLLK